MNDQSIADHPLGTPNTDGAATPVVMQPSIIDTILDLDALLSADVRRAEKMARFCTKPDLEAAIQELEIQLTSIIDVQGAPIAEVDTSVSGGDRKAQRVAGELAELRAEYAGAFRSVRMRQVADDDWLAFRAKHKKSIDNDPPYPTAFWNELIVMTAAAPKISAAQVVQLRSKLGTPAMRVLQDVAWEVNNEAGVSLPKSLISSAALKRVTRSTS